MARGSTGRDRARADRTRAGHGQDGNHCWTRPDAGNGRDRVRPDKGMTWQEQGRVMQGRAKTNQS